MSDVLLIFGTSAIISSLVILSCCYALYLRQPDPHYAALVSRYDLPYEYLNDEEALGELMDEYEYGQLSPEDQATYIRAEQFYNQNPPDLHHARGSSLGPNDDAIIKERGIQAFEFAQDSRLDPRYVVEDKTEICFNNNDSAYSTCTSILNYCLPVKHRDVSDTVYFETKVFEFAADNPNGHFSIGLVTKPYPEFRLPGYYTFSIAYESTGNLKINKPFPTPSQQHLGEQSLYNALVLPPLLQSDIVGFGYHIPSGTVFITRNGKKLMDVMKGLYVDMYPAIGCFSSNGKFHVNLGQLGFVWIEANVRKYGFISSNDFKKIKGDRGLASLPLYNSGIQSDKLLDSGEPLPPGYPEEEIDFFGRPVSDIYNLGSSSKIDEKDRDESTITDEPEEVMDLRQRIYEQSVSENSPLLNQTVYGSIKETNPDPAGQESDDESS